MSNPFEAKKLVLGGLLNEADALSKKVISSYNPSALYKVNLEKMKAHGAAYLESCAQYLGFIVRDNDKKLYQNQTILCDRMILKIESLFDIHCDECDSSYRNELTDDPPLVCQLCMQGCHSCDGMKQKAQALQELKDTNLLPPGGSWLCHACLKKNDLSLFTKPKTASLNAEPSAPPLDVIEEEVDEDGERVSPRRGRHDSDSVNQEAHPDDQEQPQNICSDYMQRKCPHGLTGKRLIDGKKCAFKHPPRCRRYCGFGEDKKLGCRRGKECKYLHPKLCRQSEISRTCMNRECSFVHLKKTKRPPKHPDVPERSHHQQNATERNRKKDPWPAPARFSRASSMNSMASLSTPYPPTVENPAGRSRKQRNNSQSDRDTAFLEKLLENLKDGIIDQMDTKMAELRDQIPSMVQESIMWNQQIPRSRQASGAGPQQVPIQTQVPFQTQMVIPHQTPFTMPTFPGSCF